MEKLVEDLILRLEIQKEHDRKIIETVEPKKDNALVLLNAGKIIAYDYTINELHRMLVYYKVNKSGLEKGI